VSYDWDITDLDGLPLDTATLRSRVMVLHVFNTDTALAVLELKSLGELQGDLAGRADVDVTLLCVSGDTPDAVRHFAEEQEVTLPLFVFQGGVPADLKVPESDDRRQQARGDTQTLVVEPGGALAMRYREPASWTADSFRDYLVRLAGGTPAPPAAEGGAASPDASGNQDGEGSTQSASGSEQPAEAPGQDEQPAEAPAAAGASGG
jgi:peroxiredoxin